MKRLLFTALVLALGACDSGEESVGPITKPGAFWPENRVSAARGGQGGGSGMPRIAFASFDNMSRLYSVNLDGTGYGLIPNGENGSDPSWSPDRRKLAFTSASSDGPGLYVMNANGTKRVRLFENQAWAATWSPDGSQILFVGRVDSTGTALMTIRPSGRDLRQLTPLDGQGRASPSWSPDGGRIVYEEYHTLGSRLIVMNADGTGVTPILDCATLAAQCSSPAWSPAPGSERIAFNLRDGDARGIVTIDSDGTDWQNVIYGVEHLMYDFRPGWSPDGSQLVFPSAMNGDVDLYVMNADGTGIRQVTFTPIVESFADWSR